MPRTRNWCGVSSAMRPASTASLPRNSAEPPLNWLGSQTSPSSTAWIATLRAANPEPATELVFASPFECLAAVLLSAQATDVGVNKATPRLFAVAPTPTRLLALGEDGLIAHISRVWLWANGDSMAATSVGMFATVINHALTMAAATRNITTAVVLPADKIRPYSSFHFSSR